MQNISRPFSHILQAAILVITSLVIMYVAMRMDWVFGIVIGALPLAILTFLFLLTKTYWLFIAIFIINYYIMGISRYVEGLQGGIIMDLTIGCTFISLLICGFQKDQVVSWKRAATPLTLLTFAWLVYVFAAFFNPEQKAAPLGSQAWMVGARGFAIYFFVISVLAQAVITKYKQMKILIFIWSILTITAVVKALWQEYVGWDAAESYWLFAKGGATTHIIFSGTRYFSFFTDAANFGCSMAFSLVVFAIAGLGEKNIPLKIYYWAIAGLATYGMLSSGTRVAIAIPFVGVFCLIVFSKQFSKILIFSILFAFVFAFFKYTTIGEGYAFIRRTRTAFNATEDASFKTRLRNQAKMKTYLATRPFGVGIGLGGGKALEYNPKGYMSQIPTDSWLVLIWVEAGIVGLSLYILLLLLILAFGAYTIMFRLKNKELRFYMIGLFGAIAGMAVASYANEIFGQFPNGFIVYIGLAMIYVSPYFDKELAEREKTIEKK
ncbi:MAG: O-antigen ligase family protein [Bacteroidales bacterium]|jgi:hypothetical protein|nr:O-antigen ligase family protein [Bacteroidales bacterium]